MSPAFVCVRHSFTQFNTWTSSPWKPLIEFNPTSQVCVTIKVYSVMVPVGCISSHWVRKWILKCILLVWHHTTQNFHIWYITSSSVAPPVVKKIHLVSNMTPLQFTLNCKTKTLNELLSFESAIFNDMEWKNFPYF